MVRNAYAELSATMTAESYGARSNVYRKTSERLQSRALHEGGTPRLSAVIGADDAHLPHLRFDWSAGKAFSPLAKRIEENQRHCFSASITPGGNAAPDPPAYYVMNSTDILPRQPHHLSNNSGATLFQLNNQGLGSDFHTWSQAMCVALERNLTLVLRNDRPWCWAASELLERKDLSHHYMDSFATYFADEVEGKQCPGVPLLDAFHNFPIASVLASDPNVVTKEHLIGRHVSHQSRCNSINFNKESKHVLRAGAMEYLFTRIRPEIVLAARRLKAKLFPGNPMPNQTITIHVRWGDKAKDSPPVPISTYITMAQVCS